MALLAQQTGDILAAWDALVIALQHLPADRVSRHTQLLSAAYLASESGLTRSSLSFLAAALDNALAAARPELATEVRLQMARHLGALSQVANAREALDEAKRSIVSVQDEGLRQRIGVSLAAIEATVLATSAPDEALAIAASRPGVVMVTGRDATPDAVLASLSDADVVHIAAHAVASESTPLRPASCWRPRPLLPTAS